MLWFRPLFLTRTLIGCGGLIAVVLIAIHLLSGLPQNIVHDISHFGEASATDIAIKERAAAKAFRTAATSCTSGTPTTCDHDSGAAQRTVDTLDGLDYHPTTAAGFRAKDALDAASGVARAARVPAALRNAASFLDAAASLADAVVTPEPDPTPGYSGEATGEVTATVAELRGVVAGCPASATSCIAATILVTGDVRTAKWFAAARPAGSAVEIAAAGKLRALVGELTLYNGRVQTAFSAKGTSALRRAALTQAASLANRLDAAVKPLV